MWFAKRSPTKQSLIGASTAIGLGGDDESATPEKKPRPKPHRYTDRMCHKPSQGRHKCKMTDTQFVGENPSPAAVANSVSEALLPSTIIENDGQDDEDIDDAEGNSSAAATMRQ